MMETLIWVNVGWISFLTFCYFLPTVCVYYRRRRNARALMENFLSIQSRLAEIERRRNDGSDDSNLQEENSQQDWECLEQLFGPIPMRNTDENNNEADNNEASRLRIIMLDILIFLGYTGHIGGTSRSRERGRRLVAALKETSMAVQECHLIAKGGAGYGDYFSGQEGLDQRVGSLDGSIEGDIELGRVVCHQNDDGNTRVYIDSDGKCNKDAAEKPRQSGLDIKSGDGNKSKTSNMNELPPSKHESESEKNTKEKYEASTGGTDSQTNGASSEKSATATDNTTPTSNPPAETDPEQNNSQNTSGYGVHPSIDVGLSTVPPQQNNPSLCLSCTDSLDANIFLPQSLLPQSTATSKNRLVSATCAICLDQYEPGCYVSWSSNKECTHAFHRDCIFMWLLKKEEPLCPCCHREFVSESALNGDVDDGNNTGDVGNNARSGE